MKRRGNRGQTFGTANGNFRRNCPNRGQEPAGFSGEFPTMQDDIHSSRKLGAALIAGFIAIVVNTSMLEAADLIPRS